MPDKPSPGPWKYERGMVYDSAGDVVCDNVDGPDGRLIASVHGLLTASEAALGELDTSAATGLSVDGATREGLRLAIQKATGRTAGW